MVIKRCRGMTVQEAIKRIIEHCRIHFIKEKGRCPLITEALMMAVKALEKQIPKKPEYDENTGIYICPNCRNVSAYDVSAFGDYCENCGQALDRSDAE